MATESWVIRLSCVDQDNQPILVHISRKSNGHALDLDLLATDGESAYRTKGDIHSREPSFIAADINLW